MTHLDGNYLDTLWGDFDPEPAGARFREALSTAEGTMADELTTQWARVCGLQGRFQQAHAVLDEIESSDPVVQQRILLERGRLHNSAGDALTARPLFQQAYVLDADPYLTVDALHMLAMVNPSNARYWYELGMKLAQESGDPRVQRWQGSLRNNWAWTLMENSLAQEALYEFIEAEEWFTQHGNARQVHIARWSVAHILRRLGRFEEALPILLDLKELDEPDTYVDEELEKLEAGDMR